MLFKILPDGLVVLLATAQVERGDVLNQALYRAVGDSIILNRALDDGAVQGLDIFPTNGIGFGIPIAGIDNELAVFGADLFGAPVKPDVSTLFRTQG